MSIAKTLLKGSFLRIIETFVSIAVGFFLLPFMVQQLGTELYGIWILIGSITFSLYLFDFGFATAVTRYISAYIGKKEYENVNRVVSSAFVIYSLLALIIVIATVIISTVSPYFVENDKYGSTIQLLILITGLSIAIEFPFKSFAGITTGYLRYDLLSISRIFIKLLNTSLIVYVLIHSQNLVYVALTGLITATLSNVLYFLIAKYVFKELSIRKEYISKDTLKSLLNYSSWAFVIDISTLLKRHGVIYIIAAFLSPGILTLYYTSNRLVDYANQILYQATSMTTPLFSRFHANNELHELRKNIIIFSRINSLLASFTVYFFFLFGLDLIELWMGPNFDSHLASNILKICLVANIIGYITNPISSAILAIKRPRYLAIMNIIETVLRLLFIFIFLFVFKFGILGVAIGTMTSYLTRPYFMVKFLCKEIDMPMKSYYFSFIKPLMFVLLISSISYYGFYMLNLENSFLTFSLQATISIISFWLFAPFILSNEEKHIIQDLLPGKLKNVMNLYL